MEHTVRTPTQPGWLGRGRSWIGSLHRPSRRRFLGLLGVALLRPRVLWAQQAPADPTRELVRMLCDRFVPKAGPHPGALALGVDAEVLAYLRATRPRLRALDAIVAELEARRFRTLSPGARDALLSVYLDAGNRQVVARYLRGVRNVTAGRYLSKRDAWPPLGYRTPQPGGYPDYALCRPSKQADGQAG